LTEIVIMKRHRETRHLEPRAPFEPSTIKANQLPQLQVYCSNKSYGYHSEVRFIIACAYAVCVQLSEDDEKLQRLKQDPFFANMDRRPRADDVTKWVVFFVFNARSGKRRERVGRHAAIINRYLDEDLKPDEVEQNLLDEGGVTKAYRLSTKRDKGPKPDQDCNDGDVDQDDETADKEGDETDEFDMGEGETPRTRQAEKGNAGRGKGRPIAPLSVRAGELLIEAPEQLMAQALLPGPLVIYAVATPNPAKGTDWMDIQATRIKRRRV